MKLITLLPPFVLGLTISFISCSKPLASTHPSKSEEGQNTVKSEFWAGRIKKPEVSTFQYGTHVLEGKKLDGTVANDSIPKTFALVSDKVKLDEWIGKYVIVTGTIVEGYPIDFGPVYVNVLAIEEDRPVPAQ